MQSVPAGVVCGRVMCNQFPSHLCEAAATSTVVSLSVCPQVQRTHAGVCKKFGIIWKIDSLLTSDTRAHIRKLSRVGKVARSVCLIEQ